ncbi:MAG: hypothetical protein J6Q82_06010 [Clostridia bacterium]|nr:hypothetical protein [Clostridia bacterium]
MKKEKEKCATRAETADFHQGSLREGGYFVRFFVRRICTKKRTIKAPSFLLVLLSFGYFSFPKEGGSAASQARRLW